MKVKKSKVFFLSVKDSNQQRMKKQARGMGFNSVFFPPPLTWNIHTMLDELLAHLTSSYLNQERYRGYDRHWGVDGAEQEVGIHKFLVVSRNKEKKYNSRVRRSFKGMEGSGCEGTYLFLLKCSVQTCDIKWQADSHTTRRWWQQQRKQQKRRRIIL